MFSGSPPKADLPRSARLMSTRPKDHITKVDVLEQHLTDAGAGRGL
jgi:hypothetical protein